MPAFDAVLVYDGDCPFCSAASSALRHAEGVGAVSWQRDAARRFLAAQFGDVPFALVLADRDEGAVRIGRAAARDLCDRAGMPVLVRDVVGDNYESLAEAVRAVAGTDREPDPYHGVQEMTPAARAAYGELADAASGMPLRMR